MMYYNRCKFCGQELRRKYEDGYYQSLYCTCEGMKKYAKLKDELSWLEQQLRDKKQEIESFIDNSLYGELNKEQNLIKHKLSEFSECELYNKF